MKASEVKSIVKAALEASPLFAAKQIPVIYNIPGDTEKEKLQENALRTKGACIAITPIITRELVACKAGDVVSAECSFSVFVRTNQAVTSIGLLDLDIDDAVDSVLAAVVGAGRTPSQPSGFKPAQDLAGIIPDQGFLTSAVRFTATIQTPTK
jgi:hypothetical protein